MSMIIEYIMPFIDGIADIFTQGGIITYIILFIGEIGRHTSELQSRRDLVCRLLLEKKK